MKSVLNKFIRHLADYCYNYICYENFGYCSSQCKKGAKKARVEKDQSGNLHIYVNEPPNEGKANKAIMESLAQYFKTKKGNIILLSGEKSKTKTFEIITD